MPLGKRRRLVMGLTNATRALSVAVTAAGLALLLAGTPVAAEPALWVAKGPHATIYLFGTIHILRRDQVWESPTIASALVASQELWLEVPDLDGVKATQSLVAQLGFDAQHPLSSKLSEAEVARLDAAAKAVDLAGGEKTLEPMRPWLASVMLEDALLIHAGYDRDSGVEHQLLRHPAVRGKRIRGFETLSQQMRFLADMTPSLERQLLRSTLQDFDQGAAKLDALVDAWMSGDEDAIARTMVDEIRKPFPDLYRTILVKRNDAWAAVIAKMLKDSGAAFIAVGAAHLAGPDSVQQALERRGIPVKRVNAAR